MLQRIASSRWLRPLLLVSALGATSLAAGEPLDRRLLSAYPRAKCNDGNAAAYWYSRGAAGNNNWIVFLDGGGGCVTTAECDLRWTRWRQGQGNNNMEGGESQQQRIFRGGMFDRTGIDANSAANPFKDWNFVVVNYCSSDEFIGGGGQLPSSTEAQSQFAAPSAYVFHGADIFDAVLRDIRSVGIGSTDDTVVNRLRPFQDGVLLLAGSSAGGKGAMNNVLRVREGLDVLGQTRTVNLRTYFVIDAYFWGLNVAIPGNSAGTTDDEEEFPLKRDAYKPKLSSYCRAARCLKPQLLHDTFSARALPVLYGFSIADNVISREDGCYGVAYPYREDCAGVSYADGADRFAARVRARAALPEQFAGYHPKLDLHTMLTKGEVFFGTQSGAMIAGRTYMGLLADLVSGVQPAKSIAD
jgi:hypothetical protein